MEIEGANYKWEMRKFVRMSPKGDLRTYISIRAKALEQRKIM